MSARVLLKKALACSLQSAPGRSFAEIFSGRVSCLNYHRITTEDHKGPCKLNASLAVDISSFEQQMAYVAGNFSCLSLSEALQTLAGKRQKRGVVVTFDDGFLDNFKLALPVLERFQIPATIYICVGLIERKLPMWWLEIEQIVAKSQELSVDTAALKLHLECDTNEQKAQACYRLNVLFKSLRQQEQLALLDQLRSVSGIIYNYEDEMLEWEQVLELDRNPLITIGSHTISHPVLRRSSAEELRTELTESKFYLEEKLGHPVYDFAFPYGLRHHASWREFDAARQAGYRSAVTMRPGYWQAAHAQQRWCLPRLFVDRKDDLASFADKVSGNLAPLLQSFTRIVTN